LIDRETLDQVITKQLISLQTTLRDTNRQLELRVRQRTHEVEARLIQIRTAAEITRLSVTASSVDDLLQRTVSLVAENFDYYEAAMNRLREQDGRCSFFVFSDDVARVEREFAGLKDLTFVRGNTQEEDLHLMASCQHIVIANSTFSWWAAWLNRHADKSVIAPKRWFGPELMDKLDTKDLLPPDWHKI